MARGLAGTPSLRVAVYNFFSFEDSPKRTTFSARRYRGSFVKCSSREELHGDRREFLVILENPTMPRVGIDDEFRVLDAAVQVLGKSRGHHTVIVAVGDECRLGELRQVRRG